MHRLGEHFKDYDSLQRIEVLPFHTLGKEKYEKLQMAYPCEGVAPPSADQIKKAKDIYKEYERRTSLAMIPFY